jgi:guanylate kinase
MKEKGLVIVISAPSGAGKTTLCRLLAERKRNLKYSISCTTRPKRSGEKNGYDYYFLSDNEFKKIISKNGFAEWALVHGYYYGTPKKAMDALLKNGYDVVMDIDVQGGLQIKKAYPQAVLVFVMAQSFKELEKRLKARQKDSQETIVRRLRNARHELKSLPRYEYLVINRTLATALKEIEEIINSEHRKTAHTIIPKFDH